MVRWLLCGFLLLCPIVANAQIGGGGIGGPGTGVNLPPPTNGACLTGTGTQWIAGSCNGSFVTPTDRYNLHDILFATPQDYDASCNPGNASNTTHDCGGALQTAAGITVGGQNVNLYVPEGYYYTTQYIPLTNAQVLWCDGRGQTVFLIDQGFNPSASGIVVGSSSGDAGPQVMDCEIDFAQPSDQTSRTNFAALGTCTSGTGGSGCKYPPAILGLSGRTRIVGTRIVRAWDCVSDGGNNTVFWIDDLECSALDGTPGGGLILGGALDFSHIKGYHFWDFGIPSNTNLYLDVYSDGATTAATFGSLNGVTITDFTDFKGRIIINGAGFFGQISNLMLDAGATLEVENDTLQPGLAVANVYTTTGSGVLDRCQININTSAQFVAIANPVVEAGNSSRTAATFCVSAGHVVVTGGVLEAFNAAHSGVSLTGGRTQITGTEILTAGSTAYTASPINVNGGAAQLVGLRFEAAPPGGTTVGGISIASDNAIDYFADNFMQGWTVNLPTFSGTPAGYYDFGDVPFATVFTPVFATEGDFAPTGVTSNGNYYLRGSFVDYYSDPVFAANAYTTASGAFEYTTNMPQPVNNTAGCVISNVNNVSGVSSSGPPMCIIHQGTNNALINLSNITNDAPSTAWSTSQIPASRSNIETRMNGRYPLR